MYVEFSIKIRYPIGLVLFGTLEMKKSVKDLITSKFVRIAEEESLSQVVVKIAEDKETMLACVLDKENKLKGIITPKEILQAVELREFGTIGQPFFKGPRILYILSSKYAKDIMSPPVSVKLSDGMEKAIEIMLDKGFYEVPVVDEQGKMIGEVNYFSIITSSLEYLKL
jgi:CBS-domain-containing membrane protein